MLCTCNLLEAARSYWTALPARARAAFRFQHVSADEVDGELAPDEPAFTEERAYAPSSPYAATKATADHLVRAWHRTYGLPVLLTQRANNYGPYQLPEKLIPLMIARALDGKPLLVYGPGENSREWPTGRPKFSTNAAPTIRRSSSGAFAGTTRTSRSSGRSRATRYCRTAIDCVDSRSRAPIRFRDGQRTRST